MALTTTPMTSKLRTWAMITQQGTSATKRTQWIFKMHQSVTFSNNLARLTCTNTRRQQNYLQKTIHIKTIWLGRKAFQSYTHREHLKVSKLKSQALQAKTLCTRSWGLQCLAVAEDLVTVKTVNQGQTVT